MYNSDKARSPPPPPVVPRRPQRPAPEMRPSGASWDGNVREHLHAYHHNASMLTSPPAEAPFTAHTGHGDAGGGVQSGLPAAFRRAHSGRPAPTRPAPQLPPSIVPTVAPPLTAPPAPQPRPPSTPQRPSVDPFASGQNATHRMSQSVRTVETAPCAWRGSARQLRGVPPSRVAPHSPTAATTTTTTTNTVATGATHNASPAVISKRPSAVGRMIAEAEARIQAKENALLRHSRGGRDCRPNPAPTPAADTPITRQTNPSATTPAAGWLAAGMQHRSSRHQQNVPAVSPVSSSASAESVSGAFYPSCSPVSANEGRVQPLPQRKPPQIPPTRATTASTTAESSSTRHSLRIEHSNGAAVDGNQRPSSVDHLPPQERVPQHKPNAVAENVSPTGRRIPAPSLPTTTTSQSPTRRVLRPAPLPPKVPVRIDRAVLEDYDLAHVRPRLEAFYRVHNPARIGVADLTLRDFSQRFGMDDGYQRLNSQLFLQYGVDLNTFDAALSPSSVVTPGGSTSQVSSSQRTDHTHTSRDSAAHHNRSQPQQQTGHGSQTHVAMTKASAAAAVVVPSSTSLGITPNAAVAGSGPQSVVVPRVRALYGYPAPEHAGSGGGVAKGDLLFDAGDLIEVLERKGRWWKGRLIRTGACGSFPHNYVEEVRDDDKSQLTANNNVSGDHQQHSHDMYAPTASSSSSSSSQNNNDDDNVAERPTSGFASSEGIACTTSVAALGNNVTSSVVTAADMEASDAALIAQGKKTNRLFQSSVELVTSEFKYVVDLRVAKDVFVTPLTDKFGLPFAKRIFSVWEELIVVHEEMLRELCAALPSIEHVRATQARLRPSATPGPTGDTTATTTTTPSSASAHYYAGLGRGIQWGDNKALDVSGIAHKLDLTVTVHRSMMDQYAELSEGHRAEVLDHLRASTVSLCQVMDKMSHFLKTSIPYIANYPRALEFVEGLGKGNPQADVFLARCEESPDLKQLHLRDFLIKPVQRVTKYPLLIREIHKYVDNIQVKEKVLQTQHNTMRIADQVNAMIKQAETMNSRKLAEFMSVLRPEQQAKRYFRPEEPSFRLYRHGPLSVTDAPKSHRSIVGAKNLYGFLVSDHLVLAQLYQNILRSGPKKYLIKVQLPLDDVSSVARSEPTTTTARNTTPGSSEDVNGSSSNSSSQMEFTVYSQAREAQWSLSVNGAGERDGWIADFAEALNAIAKVRERRMTVRHLEQQRRLSFSLQQQQQQQEQQEQSSPTSSALAQQSPTAAGHHDRGQPPPAPPDAVIAQLKSLLAKQHLESTSELKV